LAGGFVEDDGSGGGDVEGADGAGHGNRKEMVAGAAHEIVQTGAFAAKHDDKIAGEIELVVCGGAAFVETDDPEVPALELFEGANEIDDTGDAEVLRGSGTGFDGGRAEWSGAAFCEEDAVDTGTIGNAKKSAKVLRVFNTVKREQEASGGFAGRIGLEEILDSERFLRTNERDNALMCGGFRSDRELLARLLKDEDARVAALGDEAIEAFVVALARDENMVEAAATGLESFRDRMQTVEDFHGIQCSWRACYEDSLALASRLRLTPCSAARTASER
jgi:hypothetical protein